MRRTASSSDRLNPFGAAADTRGVTNVDYRLVTRFLRAQQSNADPEANPRVRRALDKLVVRLDDRRTGRRRMLRVVDSD